MTGTAASQNPFALCWFVRHTKRAPKTRMKSEKPLQPPVALRNRLKVPLGFILRGEGEDHLQEDQGS